MLILAMKKPVGGGSKAFKKKKFPKKKEGQKNRIEKFFFWGIF